MGPGFEVAFIATLAVAGQGAQRAAAVPALPEPAAPPPIVKPAVDSELPTTTLLGRVIDVHDGDSFTLLARGKDHRQIKVCLWGIDAPELGQPFGDKARRALSSKIFGKTLTVVIAGQDCYGRQLGRVTVGKTDVNLWMVQRGLAWWHAKYAPGSESMAVAEREARIGNVGLWSDADAVAPWVWQPTERATKKVQLARKPRNYSDFAPVWTWQIHPLFGPITVPVN